MNQFTKAVKSLAAKYNETSLILRIAIGLLIGAALALICPGAVWLEEFGSLFVGALKGIAPVLVFVIVASALAQGSSKLDRRFGTVVWLYMLTTFVAAALSVVTSKLFPQTLVLAEAATADVSRCDGSRLLLKLRNWDCQDEIVFQAVIPARILTLEAPDHLIGNQCLSLRERKRILYDLKPGVYDQDPSAEDIREQGELRIDGGVVHHRVCEISSS